MGRKERFCLKDIGNAIIDKVIKSDNKAVLSVVVFVVLLFERLFFREDDEYI